jgi:hypothetical protein
MFSRKWIKESENGIMKSTQIHKKVLYLSSVLSSLPLAVAAAAAAIGITPVLAVPVPFSAKV